MSRWGDDDDLDRIDRCACCGDPCDCGASDHDLDYQCRCCSICVEQMAAEEAAYEENESGWDDLPNEDDL